MKMAKMAKSNEEEEDRLSGLPDPILTDILSRLPINSAAATTVLSQRWRHLWTGVTSLNLTTDGSHFDEIVDNILRQLTSPKLFKLDLLLRPPHGNGKKKLERLFLYIIRRKVEYAYVHVECIRCECDELFWVPASACLFNSQFLSVLELCGMIKFGDHCHYHYDGDLIQLPNLKRLKFDYLLDHCLCLGTIIKSCPLLEDLELGFLLNSRFSLIEGESPVDLRCPNLKSLRIELDSSGEAECPPFHINAPKLTNLEIEGCFPCYCFVENPSALLVRACVDLRRDNWLVDQPEEFLGDGDNGEVEYLKHMSEFIRGMSSVSNLDLKIERTTNVLAYLYPMDDGFPQIFSNLTHFETTLYRIGLCGWKDLLRSLQCFPNLKHLKVNMEGNPPLERNRWCVPNCVPDCLVTTLNKIHIVGLDGSEDDLKLLLDYILSNANRLKKLCLELPQSHIREEHGKASAMWKESRLCKSLFELPRSSSTCEVLFSGNYITASSNTFKRGRLTCQIYLDV